jgi:hypothetical protein
MQDASVVKWDAQRLRRVLVGRSLMGLWRRRDALRLETTLERVR